MHCSMVCKMGTTHKMLLIVQQLSDNRDTYPSGFDFGSFKLDVYWYDRKLVRTVKCDFHVEICVRLLSITVTIQTLNIRPSMYCKL